MYLYLARHGQPEIEGRYWGHAEVNLSQKGQQTAQQIAESLRSTSLDLVISSPQGRAAQTAKVIASDQQIPLLLNAKIAAKDYGILNGSSKAEVSSLRQAQGGYATTDQRWFWKPPEGESYFDVLLRVVPFLNDLQNAPIHRVLVVTHESTLKVLHASLTKAPEMIEQSIDYGEILQFNCLQDQNCLTEPVPHC